jgi:diaminopimelate decarboxylase
MLPDKMILSSLIKGWNLDATNSGELIIGGCNALELGNIYGTPLHVVNEARLRGTVYSFLETIKSKYPGKISVHYAFKCNPVPGIIKIIKEEGIKAEVMSECELKLALMLGYKGEEIIVNGPYKTDQLITACLVNNIRFINVDSLFELERINRICNDLNKYTEVLFRINPDFVPSGMNKGSASGSRSGSQFGMDLKGGEVMKAIEKIKEMKYIMFKGFHLHIGSGIQDPVDYTRALSGLKMLLNDVDRLGFSVDVIDVGGGLGVPNSCEMKTLELLMYQGFDLLHSGKQPNRKVSFAHFAESITKGIITLFQNKKIPELIFEPGRCITGPNQLLLIKIHQVKERKGIKKWIITDAGIGTVTMPTYYEHHEVILCNDIRRKASEKVTIAGPGCFSADVVYRNKLMPKVHAGEMLAILDSGAYFTSWESSFGFPRPAIVSAIKGRHYLLRKRESFEHMIALDTL